MKNLETKTHDEMIREEAILLRSMVHKAQRRALVLRRARQRSSGTRRTRARFVGHGVSTAGAEA